MVPGLDNKLNPSLLAFSTMYDSVSFFSQCLFICLALSGLSCGTQDLSSGTRTPQLWLQAQQLCCSGFVAPWHVGSQFPDQGSNPHPLHPMAGSQPRDHQGSPLCFRFDSLKLTTSGLVTCHQVTRKQSRPTQQRAQVRRDTLPLTSSTQTGEEGLKLCQSYTKSSLKTQVNHVSTLS